MEMNEYQKSAVATRQEPANPETSKAVISLMGLVGESGGLVSEYKKYLRDGNAYQLFTERVCEELGDILWYVASVADLFNLDLDEVAQSNLVKVRDRWGNGQSGGPLSFDSAFPEDERLPRQFEITLENVMTEGTTTMRMLMDGVPIGDPLTDNSYNDDGYRFHDIFHLTCAAMLGWSPVTRKILGRKRKSKSRVDEVEDGGRATAIEEGVSALVFTYAENHNFLHGVKKIDIELLRTIKGMTKNLEVDVRSYGLWEQTILTAYNIWREFRLHDGGTLILDLDAKRIKLKNESPM